MAKQGVMVVRKLWFLNGFLLLCLVPVLLAVCKTVSTGAPAPTAKAAQDSLFFISRPLPNLDIPDEIGARSENPGEADSFKGIFREAYTAALLRGLPLTGVLGSDRVNRWPSSSPLSWSQNWASEDSEPNSWGIPGMVLALGNYGGPNEVPEAVFTVSGPILDLYGKSAGYNRANGAEGYGVPLGEPFFWEGAAIQRFSRGRVIVSNEGSSFRFVEDLYASLLANLSQEEREREFGGPDIPSRVSAVFVHAWAFAFSEEEGKSDGPAASLVFSKPWILQSGNQDFALNGFYYKSYNDGSDVFVVLNAENLPVRAYRLSGPILRTILAHKRLPGLGLEKSLGNPGGTGLGRSLATGFALYGPPLSDPLPLPAGQAGRTDVPQNTLFLEAQRFSRGWIVVVPAEEVLSTNYTNEN